MKNERLEEKLRIVKELILKMNSETVSLISTSAELENMMRKSDCTSEEISRFENEIDKILEQHHNLL